MGACLSPDRSRQSSQPRAPGDAAMEANRRNDMAALALDILGGRQVGATTLEFRGILPWVTLQNGQSVSSIRLRSRQSSAFRLPVSLRPARLYGNPVHGALRQGLLRCARFEYGLRPSPRTGLLPCREPV